MERGRVRARTGQGVWRRGLLVVLLAFTGCGMESGSEPVEAPGGQSSPMTARALGVTTRTITLEPVADATVDATQPDTPLGSHRKLVVDKVPERRTYLRFDPGTFEGTITRAVLRLYAVDPSVEGPFLRPTSSEWDEATLTWNSAPTMEGGTISQAGPVMDESWVEYDVTWNVQRGDESFIVATDSRDGVDFVSRDSPDKAHRPQLIITWVPPFCDPGSAPHVLTLAPTFDTWVDQETPDTGHSAAPELNMGWKDWNPHREAYMFFDVNTGGQPIIGSRLRLFVTEFSSTTLLMNRVNSVWTGEDFGWASRPSHDPFQSHSLGKRMSRTWWELDIAGVWGAVREGRFGFIFRTLKPSHWTVPSAGSFVSNEGAAAHRPQLLVGTGAASCSYRGHGISGTTEWWQGIGGAGKEVLRAAAPTSSGEPVLAGTWSGAGSTWGGSTLPDGGGLALARYHTDGTVAWSRGFSAQDVEVQDLAVRGASSVSNDILVLGDYDGTVDFGTGPLPAEAPGVRKLFIARFGPEGAPIWSRGFTAWREEDGGLLPAEVHPRAIAVDDHGSVMVTGFFTGTLDLGGGTLVASEGDALTPGMFVATFSSDGQHIWSQAVPGVEGRPTQGLAIAQNGSEVLVGGTLAASIDLGPQIPPSSASHPFVARFSASTGAPLGNLLLGQATGKVLGLVALNDGVLITGKFQGRVLAANGTIAQSDDPNGFYARFVGLSSRQPRWFNTFGTAGADDEGRKLVLGLNNTVWLAGTLGAETPDFRYLGGLTMGPFVAGFTIDGAASWVRNLAWNAPVHALAPMNNGDLLVGGSTQGPARIDGQTYTPAGASDLLMMKLRH